MRQGSKRDSESVKRSTAAQSTSEEILARLTAVESDLALMKQAMLKQFGIDHRGPGSLKG